MKARYIFRIDDACETLDRYRWTKIESIFDKFNVKPIVAVVPDNKDSHLKIDSPDPNFWTLVRMWKSKGWIIAMHGYQHIFHHVEKRKLIIPFYNRSEFAGLSLACQRLKIRESWNIFKHHGVCPTVWVAPAHSFDKVTLQALFAETSIRVISDGIALDVFYRDKFHWIPQQLWSFTKKNYGTWTICLHPNSMTESDFILLESFLISNTINSNYPSSYDLDNRKRSLNLFDKLYALYFWSKNVIFKFVACSKKIFAK